MMRKFLIFFFGCFILAAISTDSLSAQSNANTASSAELPIEYFTKNSERRTAKISPDGNHIVVILKQEGKEVFGVIDVKKSKITSVIGMRGAGGNVGNVRWASNTRLVYTIYQVEKMDQTHRGSRELFCGEC